jgi:flagellar hook assembly protein FlgD
LAQLQANASYTLVRSAPIEYTQNAKDKGYINHNYGEYRGLNTYKYHDGFDYYIENKKTHANIYPVSSGTAHVYPHNGDWGNCVIVNHGTFQTRYAHLSSIEATEGQLVDTDTILGLSGNTGASRGEHLHFSIGSNSDSKQLDPSSTINPILGGMIQPQYGEFIMVGDPLIKLIATGSDETFNGENTELKEDENQVIHVGKPSEPIKAIIEAYHYTGRHNSTPYKIEFEVEKILGAKDFNRVTRSIVFDSYRKLKEMVNDPPYNFSKPFVTSSEVTKDFYSVKFYPTAGTYKITAKIYSCYRDGPGDAGFHLTTPSIADHSLVERTITVGMSLVDFVDPNIYVAGWLPDDIASEKGTMVAVASVGGGVRAAAVGVEADPPEIFYVYANNKIISSNLLDIDQNLQQNVLIESRTKNKSDWTITFYDGSNRKYDELKIIDQDWLRTEWGKGKAAGVYSFSVTAKDRETGLISTREADDQITIDNIRPAALITMLKNTVVGPEDIITAQISPSEDLYSLMVNVVKSDYSLVQQRIASNPSLKKDEAMSIQWEEAFSYPDGYYRFEIIMTDLAGNISRFYSPTMTVNRGGYYPAPPTGEVYRVELPEPPSWEVRPKITDIDLDSSGNMYVLFGQTAKLVKYDPSGKEIKTVGRFNDIPMVCPLGLGLSAAGDRVYIADSYNIRLIICDNNLNLIREIKDRDAYIVEGEVDSYSWAFGFSNMSFSDSAGSGKKCPGGETYGLPEDVSITNKNVFVADRYKHRVLKYDLDGKAEKFSILKADLKDKARDKFNINSGISGQTVDKALFYSNSLNDDIYFDNSSVRETHYYGGKNWVKEMYLHNNPAGSDDGRLTLPQSVYAYGASFLYVADTGNNRVQVFNSDGSFRAKFGEGTLSQPKGIDVDSLGNIFVADTGNHRIVKFSSAGDYIREYRSEDGEITPLKIKLKGSNIYIADANYNRPLVWDIGGEIKDFGCSTKISPNGDGNGDSALIGYELTEPGKVTLRLLNSAKEEIGQLFTYTASRPSYALASDSLREKGVHNEFWGGLIKTASQEMINISEIAPDGEYFIKATVSFGDYQKSQEAKIVIDGRPPQVFISSDKSYVSPNGDGINDSARLKMTVTDYSPTVDAYLLAYRNGRLIDSPWKEFGLPTGMEREYLWNGKVDGVVYDGNYSFVLRAIDDCGNMGTGSCEVVVDSQAPLIDDFQIDNPAFSPNGDGRKDLLTASFKLRDYGSGINMVEVEVIDGNGFPIPLTVSNMPPNAFSLTWSGKDSSSQPVPDSKYRLKVTAVDKAGNRSSKTTSIEVDTIPPVIANATAEPNPFTPNGDGVKDTTTFKSHFSESVESNIMVYNEGKKLFRELRPLSMGSYLSLPWNGQGEHGEVIGGNYSYTISAEDRAGNLVTSEAGLIVVDREPSLVKYAYGENDPFSPAIEPGRIKYALSRDNLKVSVVVIGKEKQIVKTLVDGVLKNKGEYSVDWDGGYSDSYVGPHSSRDDRKVPDGAYQVKVTAYDEYNLASGEVSFNLAVDATPPYLTLQPVTVDYTAKKAVLKFYLPEKSKVTVKVFNSDSDLLTTLSTEDNDAGERQIVYGLDDGQTGSGRYFVVAAEDSAKNKDEKQSETFLIVPSPIKIDGLGAKPATFTPNGDGHTDMTQIAYSLSGGVPPYNVTVNILNPLGTIYQRLADNEPEWPGKWLFSWLPYEPLKPLPPDGHYQCQIEVTDSTGARVEGLGSILAVSTSPTVDLALSAPVFSPNDDGTLDTLDFNYTFDYADYYQSMPGLVVLQVLSTNGEILWEKGIARNAGSYLYQYDGIDKYGQKLTAGNYYVRISGADSLGSPAIYKILSFSIDYANPEPAAFSVSPAYAKSGTDVLVNLQFSEELSAPPSVQLELSGGAVRTATLISTGGGSFQYGYKVNGDENEGAVAVKVKAVDKGGNQISKTAGFIIDKTSPVISDLSISPDPVSAASICGPLSVKFKAGEPLQAAKVYVTQTNGPKLLAVTGGDWGTAGSLCEAKYEPCAGADGPAAITIEATDLAGNQTVLARSVTVDTAKPLFDRISSTIIGKADNYAKAGDSVTISFYASEALPLNPTVKVNDNNCSFVASDHEFSYRYDIGEEIEGPAVITISGQDYAGNEGFVQTSSTAESFVVDLLNPTVGIAEPGSADIIASPSPFYTNADPLDTGDRPNYTTLRYSISEDGHVTLKVHRVPNDQTIYAASDFREENRAATVLDDVLQFQGTHNLQWRGESTTLDDNNDGFADPGKYAFIVEVRDRAGNLTQRKWGGTVWIKVNVLDIIQPSIIGLNPDPLYFSPVGNSSLNSTKIWFDIFLSTTPEGHSDPERIEAMGLSASKRVGTYAVKVHDIGDNLIRTIVKDISAFASPEAVIWDGRVGTGVDKLAAGDPAVDGAYKISVEVKDFAGNPGSPFSKWVTVDSTPPIITDNQPGNDTWANSSGTLYDVDFADNGSKLSRVLYQVRRPDNSFSGWLPLTTVTTGAAGYTDNWPVDWAVCGEGVNYVTVKAFDRAGNEAVLTDVFYIKKDTASPGTCLPPSPPRTPYNQLRPLWTWSPVSDVTSGVKGYYIKIGTSAGGDNVVSSTYVGDVTSWMTNSNLWHGATFYASVQSQDNAGNYGDWGNAGLVTIDAQPPTISDISDDGPFSPGASQGSDDLITFNYSVNERCDTYLYVDNIIIHNWVGSGPHSFTWNPTTSVSEGARSYRLYAIDDADNTANSSNYSFMVDNTPPTLLVVGLNPGINFIPKVAFADGVNNSTSIDFSVSGATAIDLEILDSGDNPIRSFSNISSPVVWDLKNNSGSLVPVGKYSARITAKDAALNSASWTSPNKARVKSRDEIIMVDDNQGNSEDIRIFNIAKGSWTWSTSFWSANEDLHTSSAAGDFMGNGQPLLAVRNSSNELKVINPRSHGLVSSFSIPNDPGLAACDYDGDGVDEVAALGNDGWIRIYNYNGSPRKSFKAAGNVMAAGDFDEDGKDEIVTIQNGGTSVYLFDPGNIDDGASGNNYYSSWSAPQNLGYVACGNMTGDGKDEIVMSSPQVNHPAGWSNCYYVYSASGSLLNTIMFQDASPYNYVTVGDYAGDGYSEVAAMVYNGNNWTAIFNPMAASWSSALLKSQSAGGDYCSYPTSEDLLCSYDFTSAYAIKIDKITTKAVTLETPSLLAPTKDRQDVQNIRPAFEWEHHKADTTEYRVEVAKNDSFTIDHQTFSKAAGTGTQDKADSNLYYFNYAIHEFDPGLERNTDYFWKVTALSPTNAATSESWGFRIQPELTLAGVTNYPNPFNPNREETKLRYRLSADADEVRIRIYDITGSLVTELDGTTNGEGMSVWQKYNDVSWDGRNGRGDMVVNGIYPFEITARMGDKTVSGRGKIAVLK